jgi:hypothetical protein
MGKGQYKQQKIENRSSYRRQDNMIIKHFLNQIKSSPSVKTTLFWDVILCTLVDADVWEELAAAIFRVEK